MPNWVYCTIEITGNKKDLRSFMEQKTPNAVIDLESNDLQVTKTKLIYKAEYPTCIPYSGIHELSSQNPTLLFHFVDVSKELCYFGEFTWKNGEEVESKLIPFTYEGFDDDNETSSKGLVPNQWNKKFTRKMDDLRKFIRSC